ncbi:MAG TPA: hypothetical protein VE467_19645, partial [Chryseolinea sp.]|nr:hypothetical protein [Chryseolinea sp.]
ETYWSLMQGAKKKHPGNGNKKSREPAPNNAMHIGRNWNSDEKHVIDAEQYCAKKAYQRRSKNRFERLRGLRDKNVGDGPKNSC